MKSSKNILLAVAVMGILSACSIVQPPKPALPARDTLSSGETITVPAGKSIYAVARDHNVSMRDLIVLNNLQPPFVLKPGQNIILPLGAGTAYSGAPTFSSSGVAAAPLGSVDSTSVETMELAPPPPAPAASSKLTQVDALNKPAPAAKAVTTTMNAPKVEMKWQVSPSTTTTAAPTPVTAPVAAPVPEKVTNIQRPVAPPPEKNDAPDTEPPSFVWPVQGPVLSAFGPKGQGLNNDGVNIGAPKGAAVVASAGGIVVYAGNEMKGFGNLVLIRHEGGWVTAYAHLDRVLVTKDAVVASGDMIGTVGKTGTATAPQLHFEIRHNSKAVDPTSLIDS